jgi:formate/nitrite transporter
VQGCGSSLPTAHGGVGRVALVIAQQKTSLGFVEAFVRGAFCNALVCLAVWLTFSARTTTDKVLCVVFPIAAFVAAGFEHSIANMYFVPLGMLQNGADVAITWRSFFVGNLLPVTLGNLVGGSLMVGFVYWFVYLRKGAASGRLSRNVRRTRGRAS